MTLSSTVLLAKKTQFWDVPLRNELYKKVFLGKALNQPVRGLAMWFIILLSVEVHLEPKGVVLAIDNAANYTNKLTFS